MLKILKKMKHEYGGKWSDHLVDVLWAYRSFVKTTTGFSPFSLVYGTEAISPVELVVPASRVVLEENQEDTEDTNNEKILADLEGLEEEREVARRRSQRNQQRMAKVYAQIVHPMAFTEEQLVLRTIEHVRKNLPGPSKGRWDGPDRSHKWEVAETILCMKRERPQYTETFLPALQPAKCFIVLYFLL